MRRLSGARLAPVQPDAAINATVARQSTTPAIISQRVSTLKLWIISPRSTAVSTLRERSGP
jgi:hypothetical protein